MLDRALARLIDHVQSDPPAFGLFSSPRTLRRSSGEDDRDVNRRIAGYCRGTRPPILVEERCDPTEITGLYASLDFLVGMRFHSVIFALTSYVPSIAIEYHYKARGIMRDLGLEEWVLALDDVVRKSDHDPVRPARARKGGVRDASARRVLPRVCGAGRRGLGTHQGRLQPAGRALLSRKKPGLKAVDP